MYSFLLIDDSKQDAEAFQDTIKRLNLEAEEEKFRLEIANTFEDGMSKVSESFNGIIVDIRLDGEHTGNEIICNIVNHFRTPVAVFTGTPDTDLPENSPIPVFKKGEASHKAIIDELSSVSDTGLFNVLGSKGIIENMMTRIFWDNLYPQIKLWRGKHESGIKTEGILLRYAVAHIQELIDCQIPTYVTEEMYISPPVNSSIQTGSIVQSKTDSKFYIVLSPPCDLAMHDGKAKTDSILLCRIEPQDDINHKLLGQITKQDKKVKHLASALNNNYTDYYHWLPQNTLFSGGYINFRKVLSCPFSEINSRFDPPKIKIQESFVKSILGRFSTYYARQGQPDFDFNLEAKAIVEKMPEPVAST